MLVKTVSFKLILIALTVQHRLRSTFFLTAIDRSKRNVIKRPVRVKTDIFT